MERGELLKKSACVTLLILLIAVGITAATYSLVDGHWVIYVIGWVSAFGLFNTVIKSYLRYFLYSIGASVLLGVIVAGFVEILLGIGFGLFLCFITFIATFSILIIFERMPDRTETSCN
ncbi:MAG: hypothetical protein ACI8Q1_003163 [Parvicella sp.]|jgi:hypothetical protein